MFSLRLQLLLLGAVVAVPELDTSWHLDHLYTIDSQAGRYTQIRADGNAAEIVWNSNIDGLRLARCENFTCSRWAIKPTSVKNLDPNPRFINMKLESRTPTLAHTAANGTVLALTRCLDMSCSNHTVCPLLRSERVRYFGFDSPRSESHLVAAATSNTITRLRPLL